MLTVSGKNAIGYQESASGNRIFYAVNASTGAALPTAFVQATVEEVNSAAQKAEDAFPLYSAMPLNDRRAFIFELARRIRDNKELLVTHFCLETGLSAQRGYRELERSCFQLENYMTGIMNGLALEAKITPGSDATPDLRKVNVALGPVVVFGASNFPFAYSTIGGDVASALAAGCPVIVKAHPMHPHTSELCARIVLETARDFSLPDGVFSHLFAEDYTVGEQLVKHPFVKAIGFTGSIAGGTALQQLANGRPAPIPVFAEMGSTNPMVFTEAALRARGTEIARQVADSIALDAGQFCTSPGLLFVVKSAASTSFVSKVRDFLSRKEKQVMLHPEIFQRYQKQAERQLAGAEVLFSGMSDHNRIVPSIVRVSAGQFLAEPARREEVFGSFAIVVESENEPQMRQALASLEGQLTASLFAETGELGTDWLDLLQQKSGRLIVNGVPTGVTVAVSMQHGGPYPSSTQPYFSAVGSDAVKRFMRPVSYQNVPDQWLPDALKRANPLQILRFVNGFWTRESC